MHLAQEFSPGKKNHLAIKEKNHRSMKSNNTHILPRFSLAPLCLRNAVRA